MAISNRMLWQCRRGSLELDLLLNNYLEKGFPTANAQEQTLFSQLLAWPDDDLLAMLWGNVQPDTDDMRRLVEQINVSSRIGSGTK
jgi:antitoxin CptB